MHNVTIVNLRQRPGLARGSREIDTLQPTSERAKAWSDIVATDAPALSGRQHLRTWLPQPRIRCINLDRASEGRKRFTKEWIDGLGLPVRFFPAIGRRDIESGRLSFPYDDAAAISRIGRSLTAGEIACAATHALLMFEEAEFCGPEGVFIIDDDYPPIAGAEARCVFDRVLAAMKALPGIEAVACQKPWGTDTIRQGGRGATPPLCPPYGPIATWYGPKGLRCALGILSRMECPADWMWCDMSALGKFAVLDPRIDRDEASETR